MRGGGEEGEQGVWGSGGVGEEGEREKGKLIACELHPGRQENIRSSRVPWRCPRRTCSAIRSCTSD